ncbi:glycosyltransferase family 4 protein [Paenibacillus sp. 481]|uniref:glycosyltransferase family 4 protein n=1 Tax=Paenibacillus sp. 481 TaxID=2835869 RepID=UPI001E461280|nr:glycosyltransferase family 4 protein [Paenibacillus sp. 481]UHA74483.1 glycosyltransferase family 4 protein [Paenibacillus sp. 481]
MNILLATYWEIPHLGGVWPLMSRLKTDLEALGHRVDIFGNGVEYFHLINQDRKFMKSDYSPLIETRLSASALTYSSIIYHTEVDRYCMEVIAASIGLHQYDLIHTHDVISARAISRVKPRHIPLLVNPHGSLLGEIKLLIESHALSDNDLYMLYNYYYSLEMKGVMSSNHALTSSQWLKHIFEKDYLIPSSHVSVFPYGIDIGQFIQNMQLPTTLTRPANKKVITFTGRIVYLKGIETLLFALAQLKRFRNDWVCWIVGEGAKRQEYEQLAVQLGIGEDVVFWGGRADIPQFMALTDIYVQPSLQDNQPLSVIEAQIAGKPVIVSSACGLPEMVQHGTTGLIVPPADPESLCGSLNHLLAHEEWRQQLGAQAQQFALHYWSIERYNEEMWSLYEKVCGKRIR